MTLLLVLFVVWPLAVWLIAGCLAVASRVPACVVCADWELAVAA